MTDRERRLTWIFGLSALAVAILLGMSALGDEFNRLDREWVLLQKRALSLVTEPPKSKPITGMGLLLPPGTVPSALSLADTVRTALSASGLVPKQSQIVEATDKAVWMSVTLQTEISNWFRFLRTLSSADPRCGFRTLSMARKESTQYSIVFEVGYASGP